MILEYKNIAVNYTIEGKGDPIILIHGFLENNTMWSSVIDVFKYTHQIITLDLLGHGKTDCLGYIHTVEENANIIYEIIKKHQVKKATLIGHSLGGYVALAFAELHKCLVEKICLVNSTPFADSDLRKETRSRAIKAAQKNYNNLVSMSISNLFYEKNRLKFKEQIELLKIEALKTPLQGYIATQEGMKIRKDRSKILNDLQCDKLIISGKNDPILNNEDLKKLNQINNLKISIISGGHMSYIENRSDFLQEIMHFIE